MAGYVVYDDLKQMVLESGGAKKYAPVPVAQKQDLFSAPILKALEA